MQQPTCTNLRIRSTNDAHRIFAAIQRGLLHMVTRRLDADERLALRSGCIYAWEERGPHSELTGLGIERFTEGRRWSPSRVRDEFLFYYEKYSPPADAGHTLTGSSSDRPPQPPRDWDPLVKQTYSVFVETDKGRRKWHLTAYFTQTTIDQLSSIDDNPLLRDIVVEEGMFRSTRVGKSRSKTDDSGRSESGSKSSSSQNRTYAPFPTPYQYQQQNDSASTTPVLMHQPYRARRVESSGFSEQNHSPVSALAALDHSPYNASAAQANAGPYMSPGYAVNNNAMGSSSNHSSHHLSNYPAQHSVHSTGPSNAYYSPSPSHSSWGTQGNPTYYQRGDHQELTGPHNGRSPTLLSSPDYGRPVSNQTPSSPHPPYATNFSAANVHAAANPLFSPSYSLHAALALPPGSEAMDIPGDMVGPPLSPLHIPDRMRGNAGSPHSNLPYSQSLHVSLESGNVSMDATGDEEGASENGMLRPLSLLRPPVVKYVRDLQDEKILRRLRERNSNA